MNFCKILTSVTKTSNFQKLKTLTKPTIQVKERYPICPSENSKLYLLAYKIVHSPIQFKTS